VLRIALRNSPLGWDADTENSIVNHRAETKFLARPALSSPESAHLTSIRRALQGCTTGTAGYDGAGGQNGYVTAFEIGVKENTNPINLYATELSFPQSFYAAGGRFPALYDFSDTTDWGKYNPDVWQTDTPSISAAHAFQTSP
jgi:hypothetical protein